MAHLRFNIGVIKGLYRDNGKENGNYRGYRGYVRVVMLGLYRDNGKENGNYDLGFRV